MTSGAALADNIVVNGGFETGDFSGWTQGGSHDADTTFVSDLFPHSGVYGTFLGPERTGYLSQSLATTPGATYDIQFFLASDGGTDFYPDGPINSFSVSFNGLTLGTLVDAPYSGYIQYSFQGHATSGSTALQFAFVQPPAYWHLDDVSVQETPEPASLTLLGTGLLGIASVARKRFSKV